MVIRFRSEKHLVNCCKSGCKYEGTYNNCLFVEVFNYFLNCSNKLFDFLASNS